MKRARPRRSGSTRKQAYHSPLREAQRSETSERILEACAAVLGRGGELTYAAVAQEAGIQERTVYRHYADKEQLESAFWWWQNRRIVGAPVFEAATLPQLVQSMRKSFQGFETNAGLVEAMLFSRQGMAVRLQGNERRMKMFRACLAEATEGLDARAALRAAAAAQVLYSAPSWQMLRRFWGMEWEEAAATVEQALVAMAEGLRRRGAAARRPSKKNSP